MEFYSESQDFNIREVWRILIKRRWMIVISLTVMFLVTLIMTFMQKPIYQAASTIQVEGPGAARNIFSGFDQQGVNLRQYNAMLTEMQIIKSRSIAEEVVRRLRLNQQISSGDEGLNPRLQDAFTSPEAYNKEYKIKFVNDEGEFELTDATTNRLIGQGRIDEPFNSELLFFTLSVDRAAKGKSFSVRFRDPIGVANGLSESISAREIGENTNIFQLSVQHPEPEMAREIVNTVAEVYLERNIKRKSQEASQTLDFINSQLDVIKAGLESSEAEIDRFKTEEGIVSLDRETNIVIDQLADQEAKRSALELKLNQIDNLERRIINRSDEEGFLFSSSAFHDEVLSNLVAKYTEVQLRLQQALTTFTDNHPEVRRLNAQSEDIKSQILSAIANTRAATRSSLDGINGLISQMEGRIRRLPKAERQLARLVRTSRVNEEIYTFLLKKHEEARIVKAATVANIRIIDPAVTPTKPVKPDVKLNLISGTFIGLLIGLILAMGAEYLDDTVKSIEQIERDSQLPVFGTIPQVNSLTLGGTNGNGQHNGTSLITNFDNHSPYSEAYRALRTNTQFLGLENEINVLLFTSALQKEGKSTTSSNLAITTANMGTKTLLVDCDLRRPSIHRLFEKSQEPGLTNIVMGTIDWPTAVQSTNVENLDIICSGPLPPNPSELLASGRMRALIEDLKKSYDMIIIDSPPVIVVTDAAILSTMVDAVFFVVQVGKTPIGAVMRTRAILENVKGNVRGAVLNNISADHGAYYGYYNYYHYSSYYSYYHHGSRERELKPRSLVSRAGDKIRGLLKS